MAYGSTAGLRVNIKNYDSYTAGAEPVLTAADVTAARTKSDNWIDNQLVSVVAKSDLPLAVSSPVDGISDDMTTYHLLRGIFTQKNPNLDDWVDTFKETAEDNLKTLVASGSQGILDASGSKLANKQPQSNTDGQDRIFSLTRTTQGNISTGPFEDSMDDW